MPDMIPDMTPDTTTHTISDTIQELISQDYEQEVLAAGGAAVVDFYSTECPPCEALAAKYHSLAELYGDEVRFYKIFRQENRELAEKLGIASSPTIFFVKDGKIVGDRLSGGIKRRQIEGNLRQLVDPAKLPAIDKRKEPKKTQTDVLIVGGGPAGLTTAIYAAQAHLKTLVVDPALPGGQVSTTHQVSNYPGFIQPIQGYMLSHNMAQQAKAAGAEFRAAVDISDIDLDKRSVLVDGLETIEARAIVLSTGSRPRALDINGEREYKGQGISYCATCDAKYYEGKDVIVIGGGNSAIEESLFLAKFARSITVVHQFEQLQANEEAQQRARNEAKISFVLQHEPREFVKRNDGGMDVRVENLVDHSLHTLSADGVFVFVGMQPNVEEFEQDVSLDDFGYIVTNDDMQTSLPGVYAVGDVRSKKYRQISIAVGEGTIAAMALTRELG